MRRVITQHNGKQRSGKVLHEAQTQADGLIVVQLDMDDKGVTTIVRRMPKDVKMWENPFYAKAP